MVNGLKEGQSSLIKIIGLGTINPVTLKQFRSWMNVIFPVYPLIKTLMFALYPKVVI